MKINLNSIDTANFITKAVSVAGEDCTLVIPQHIGCEWAADNLHLRSSIWNSEGELISAGFPKFGNLGENPAVFGLPESIAGADILEKMDGSLLIVSWYNGQLIVRTRGTVDATELENGHEIAELKALYPNVFAHKSSKVSYLYEWLSPTNRIVIRHDTLALRLIGAVYHDNYSLASQDALDVLADSLGVERPKRFAYSDLQALTDDVKQFVNSEGVVLYTVDGKIYKVKGEDYLIRHKLKSSLRSIKSIVDYWYKNNRLDKNEMMSLIEKDIDWETAQDAADDVYAVLQASHKVDALIKNAKTFATYCKGMQRRNAALAITRRFGKDAGLVFTQLDGKEICEEVHKKLLLRLIT